MCIVKPQNRNCSKKNYNKEKKNYTCISHTSEWRFSPITVTGLNSLRGIIIIITPKGKESCPPTMVNWISLLLDPVDTVAKSPIYIMKFHKL